MTTEAVTLTDSELDRAIAVALAEDLGGGDATADVTTTATVAASVRGRATVRAKADGVVCGLGALQATFDRLGGGVGVELHHHDGDAVAAGDVLATLVGPARVLLVGERTALNLIGHLSGIATLARAFADRAAPATILDTRKTLPGLRALQKHAVRCGGGTNHRSGLYDAVLIKDNHIAAAGGVARAVHLARATASLRVEVECTSGTEVEEALEAGADEILLDNRPPAELTVLVELIRSRAPGVVIEASGGVTLDAVAAIAATGVDRISVGALTHSAPALDVSMDLELED